MKQDSVVRSLEDKLAEIKREVILLRDRLLYPNYLADIISKQEAQLNSVASTGDPVWMQLSRLADEVLSIRAWFVIESWGKVLA
jgi:hypothetical protein